MNKLKEMMNGKPYLETWDEVKNLPWDLYKVGMSDFMLANGGWASKNYETASGTPTCWSFLVSRRSGIDYFGYDGADNYYTPKNPSSGVAPALKFNLPSETSARSASASEVFGCEVSIGEEKYKDGNGKTCTYHTITFANTRGYGEKADQKLSKTLEKEFVAGKLKKLNRQITGRMNDDKTFKKFDIYEYQGKEYAYVEAKQCNKGRKVYLDGSPIIDGQMVFIEMKPATMVIRNEWKKLPKYINPKGTGKATELVVKMQNAVNGGVPFSQSGSIKYTSDECDIRRYVENEFVQEFFVDDEQETQITNFDLNAKLDEILATEKGATDKVLELNEIASAYFVKDSESMGLIANKVVGYISCFADELYAQAKTLEEVATVEFKIVTLMKTYKKLVENKRIKQAEIDEVVKKLEDAKGVSSTKTKTALSDLKKFKHQKFPSEERVHMDRHSFHDEEQF